MTILRYPDFMPSGDSITDDEAAPSPTYSESGVDLSLIRWMLSLTPLERLHFLENRIRDIVALRNLNARD